MAPVPGLEAALERLYANSTSPAAFSGLERLYREARIAGIRGVTRSGVKNFLLQKNSFTKFRKTRSQFPGNPVRSYTIFHLVDADLHFMPPFNRFKYFMVVFDILSRRVYAGALTSKEAKKSVVGPTN